MFNRKLVVDVVKKPKSQPVMPTNSDIGFERKAMIVAGAAERCVKLAGFAVCAYVLLDTFRKVAVASVEV